MEFPRLSRPAWLAAALVVLALPAAGQTVQPRIAVGTNPLAVAVNPVTNKVYVANAGSNNLTIIDGATATASGTLPMGAYPAWMGINPETNRIYVSSLTGANTTVVNGGSDTVVATLASGGAGWTAVDAITGRAYVVRYGAADEVNFIQADAFIGASATRSFTPVGIAVNPVTNWVYNVNAATGDISVIDFTTYTYYPPLKCPDGSGGFRPQPPDPPPTPPDPYSLPCIDIPGTPVAVAINPVTNRIYGLSETATGPISVINGANHTYVSVTPSGGLAGARAIAVNPVTNKVYSVFANGIAVVNGADNTTTTIAIASGNAVAIGINVLTNKVYVPKDNGELLVIDGATNASGTITGLTAGSTAIAVNPITNTIYIADSAGGVTPVAGPVAEPVIAVGITTTVTPLAGNASGPSGTITLNATSAMTPAPLDSVRKVYFRIDDGPWTVASGSGTGPWTASFSGLATGNHTLQAFATNGLDSPSINADQQNVPIVGNVAAYAFSVSPGAAPQIGLAPASLDFGGQSMGTTSPSRTVTVTNTGTGTLEVTGISASAQFGQTNNCSSLAAGASCTIQVTFSPAIAAGALNSSTPVAGTLTVTSNAAGSPHAVALAGSAEKSLVTHYYRSILRRAPDAGGKAFWTGETARVVGLGANVNEAWYAIAAAFYNSAEYVGFNRDDAAFITDLYNTFFNRTPDAGGLAYWSGELAAGLPREVLLAAFMFSPEFGAFSQSIFGNTQVRAEIDAVTDFYRGLLARLPDDGGFGYWVQRFRAAQCQGSGAVYAEVEAISSAFAQLPEYAARNRGNAQFVGDLYNAFLRRGGDRAGVQFWIDQLASGSLTREQVRQAFIGTPEFGARVNAIVSQGCIN